MNFLKKLFGLDKHTSPTSELDEKINQILKQAAPYKRTAYIPITKSKTAEFSTDSKFGGYPYLRHEEDWPVCPNCANHMQLFLQLDLEKIPTKKEEGLLQLFYCTNEEQDCEGTLESFFHFSEGYHSRIIKIEAPSVSIVPKIDTIFEEKIITDWNAQDDYPHYEEYAELGIDFDYDLADVLEERNLLQTIQKDKLFGWPFWVQSIEYPNDRKTGNRMELLFQIDSEDNIPFLFGDCGTAHLTQSPDDKNEMTFGWACY
ncbi:DUF1963 domain-containing protein [Flavobacterium sp.]|uniref:DUF1963 domain-containing protein n=1 Tax=Flavobacterium sp. TaxID=239 RepID=UPI003D1512E3